VIVAAAAAFALALTAGPAHVTPHRVGPVKLGASYASLHEAGLIGRQRVGCDLEGPGTRAALLRAPLRGVVELTRKEPRRVKSIIVTRHATARGLAIGARRGKVEHAFPKATFDKSVQDTFGITLVRVPKDGGGKLQMALDAKTGRLTEFGIPYIRFCE
jgi:hypothetical protein